MRGVDGICSATLTYNILRWYGIKHHNIITFFHTDKAHGLTDGIAQQIVAQNNISMVIVPDAGSNDVKQIQKLIKKYSDKVFHDV